MDLTTILGVVAGLALVVGAIASGEGGLFFLDLPAFMIVFGGVLGSTLINFRMKDLLSVVGVLRKVFTAHQSSSHEVIDNLVRYAEKARREGVLSLERELTGIDDEFTRKGIQYVVDGAEPETIRVILEAELISLEERHKLGQSMFVSMAQAAPAFGMIGTLIGLIQMLRTLDNPALLGAGMATALVTTFYGALSAYLFFQPIAGKLANRSKEETLQKELIMEGIISIQSGDNPRIVREKLFAYIAPKQRVSYQPKGGV
jgi:chemotaxis protein MotA